MQHFSMDTTLVVMSYDLLNADWPQQLLYTTRMGYNNCCSQSALSRSYDITPRIVHHAAVHFQHILTNFFNFNLIFKELN